MPRPNPIEYNGVTYRSGNALAKAYGINYKVLHKRLENGWTVEEAIQGHRNTTANFNAKQIEYNGVMYESISALARAYNMKPELVQSRLNHGWTVEETVQGYTFNIEYKGVRYKSRKALAEAYGIDGSVLNKRINEMGYSLEEALERKFQKKKSIEYNGVKYESIVVFANAYNINENTVRNRIKNGWTVEEIVQGYKNKKAEIKEIVQKIEVEETAQDYNGKKVETDKKVHKKIHKNQTHKIQTYKKQIEYNGVIYKSKKALAEAYGISVPVFCERLRKGMTIEEALKTHFIIDPNGRVFASNKEMVDYWHNVLGYEITPVAFLSRMKAYPDKMLENLTRPLNQRIYEKKVYDHCGNAFDTQQEMLDHWNITIDVWRTRRRWGWDLEKILTTPMPVHAIECVDHLGNKFESRQKMLDYWGITRKMWEQRRHYGWTLEEILTLPKYSYLHKNTMGKRKPCKDHLGNEFDCLSDMADYWGVTRSRLEGLEKKGIDLTDMQTLKKILEAKPTSYGEQVICYTLKTNGMKFVHNMGFTYLSKRFSNIDFDKVDEKIQGEDVEFKYYAKRKNYTLLRPDFCLFDDDKVLAIIEYNGSQHYVQKHFLQTAERFEKKCEGDKFKKFATNVMGIPFFVIDEKRKGNLCDEEYVVSELMNVIQVVRNLI